MKELFPQAQVTIGPHRPGRVLLRLLLCAAIHQDDLKQIEERMKALAKLILPLPGWLCRGTTPLNFPGSGEAYKAEIIRSIPGQ